MKTATLPSLRVDPQLRDAAQSVLQEGETLSGFIEASVRESIDRRRVRAEFVWEKTLEPLVSFVAAPHRAADMQGVRANRSAPGKRRKPYGFGHDTRMFWHYLRAEGPIGALRRVSSRFTRSR